MTKINLYYKKNLLEIQKEMRKTGELINEQTTITKAENIIGQALIDSHIPIIPQYEVNGRSYDFKVYHYPILIEIDGGIHNTSPKRLNDYIKDRYVQRRGFRVYRFANLEIYNDKYLRKAVGEVKSLIKYCGSQPREVYLYPMTLWEQIKLWWCKVKGKKFPRSVKVEFLK
jgi:very-short-patch-repair endonuclease